MGLREEKKRHTRKAISDLATRLFIEQGYDQVTTAQIATLSKVSIPTLFKYFPTKEALVFDEDLERENQLLNAVKNRKKNQSILDALLEMGVQELETHHSQYKKGAKAFLKMVEETPALKIYGEQMWSRHEKALGNLIKKESKSKISLDMAESIARFVLDSFHRSVGAAQPKETLVALFGLMREGWRG